MRFLSVTEVSSARGKTSAGTRRGGIKSNSNYGTLGNEVASQSVLEVTVIPVRVTAGHKMKIGHKDTRDWWGEEGGGALLHTAAVCDGGACFNHCLGVTAIYIPLRMCFHSLCSLRCVI